MIRIGAFTRGENGWSRQSRSFAAALSRHEQTQLLDWESVTPGRWPHWRRLLPSWRQSVGVGLGAPERTFALDTRYHVVWHVGETTRLRKATRYLMERADMVWTPSHWARAVLESNGITAGSIRIVPEGVDPDVFKPPAQRRSSGAVFRFVCVAKWEERKGLADLVRVFRRAFRDGEPVELVMHCGASEVTAEAVARALDDGSANQSPRIVCTDPMPLTGLVALMQNSDAFVLPTRGEGWGLPILEAMACELPCIVTGYSGLTEFANEENSFLISVRNMAPVDDPRYYDPNVDWGEWAQPDLDHLEELMRYVYKNRDAARVRAKRARADAVAAWTWHSAARRALEAVQELRARN